MKSFVTYSSIDDPEELYERDLVITAAVSVDQCAKDLIDKGLTGEGYTIAILDTGVDPEHPMLKGRVYGEPYDLVDPVGHGTMVACLAAGDYYYSKDWGPIYGVARKAKILSIRILNEDGRGSATEMAKGIHRAIDHGVDVINISAGISHLPYRRSSHLRNAVERARRCGIPVIAAIGNEGGKGRMNIPARYRWPISVAPINYNGDLAEFSSKGLGNNTGQVRYPGGGGGPNQEIEWIYSGTSEYSEFSEIWDDTGDMFAARRGSSMACGLGSGTFVLLLEQTRGDISRSRRIFLIRKNLVVKQYGFVSQEA